MEYRSFKLCLLCAAACLSLAVPVRAAPLGEVLLKAELAPLGQAATVRPFQFDSPYRSAQEAGTLEVDLSDGETFGDSAQTRYLLRLQVAVADAQVAVRERTVIYMNVGDDGPHAPIVPSERRSAWRPVARGGPQLFQVGGLSEPVLKLNASELLAAVKRSEVGQDPRWLAVARSCSAPDQGACYTTTDAEYEVSVTRQGRLLSRGVLRLRRPNGC